MEIEAPVAGRLVEIPVLARRGGSRTDSCISMIAVDCQRAGPAAAPAGFWLAGGPYPALRQAIAAAIAASKRESTTSELPDVAMKPCSPTAREATQRAPEQVRPEVAVDGLACAPYRRHLEEAAIPASRRRHRC